MSRMCRLPLASPTARNCWFLDSDGSRKPMHMTGRDTTDLVSDGLLVWSTKSHTSIVPSCCTPTNSSNNRGHIERRPGRGTEVVNSNRSPCPRTQRQGGWDSTARK